MTEGEYNAAKVRTMDAATELLNKVGQLIDIAITTLVQELAKRESSKVTVKR